MINKILKLNEDTGHYDEYVRYEDHVKVINDLHHYFGLALDVCLEWERKQVEIKQAKVTLANMNKFFEK